jgi:Uma2 family endonuclease
MAPNEEIAQIKREHFARLAGSRQVWLIEEAGGQFTVHHWTGPDWINGPGVAPQSDYPTLRKAAARLLQLLRVGPVAPQTWPEEVCVGVINREPA